MPEDGLEDPENESCSSLQAPWAGIVLPTGEVLALQVCQDGPHLGKDGPHWRGPSEGFSLCEVSRSIPFQGLSHTIFIPSRRTDLSSEHVRRLFEIRPRTSFLLEDFGMHELRLCTGSAVERSWFMVSFWDQWRMLCSWLYLYRYGPWNFGLQADYQIQNKRHIQESGCALWSPVGLIPKHDQAMHIPNVTIQLFENQTRLEKTFVFLVRSFFWVSRDIKRISRDQVFSHHPGPLLLWSGPARLFSTEPRQALPWANTGKRWTCSMTRSAAAVRGFFSGLGRFLGCSLFHEGCI